MPLNWHVSHRGCPHYCKSSQAPHRVLMCVCLCCDHWAALHMVWPYKSRHSAHTHLLWHLPRAVRQRAKGCVGLMSAWPGVRSFMKSLRWVLDWGETTVIHNPVTLMIVGRSALSLELHISSETRKKHWGDYNHINQFLLRECFMVCLQAVANLPLLIWGTILWTRLSVVSLSFAGQSFSAFPQVQRIEPDWCDGELGWYLWDRGSVG